MEFRVIGREGSDCFQNVRNAHLQVEPGYLAFDRRKNALIEHYEAARQDMFTLMEDLRIAA
jgi:hypothetical protein